METVGEVRGKAKRKGGNGREERKGVEAGRGQTCIFTEWPWLLLRRCNLSNIRDRVRAGPSDAENNPSTNPNPNPNISHGHLYV